VLRTVGSLSGIGLIGATHAQNEPQEISECTVIDDPGEYVLTRDFSGEGRGPCIDIQADGVVLDGDGHRFYSGGGQGIRVTGQDVIVRNVRTGGWGPHIEIEDTTGARIESSSLRSADCATINRSRDVVITGCQFLGEYTVVTGGGNHNIRIEDNVGNMEGSAVDFTDTHHSTVRRNQFESEYGLLRLEGDFNTIEKNHLTQFLSPAITVRGRKNQIVRNTTRSAYTERFDGMASIWLRNCDDSLLMRNDIQYGNESGLFLEDSDDNLLLRNVVCGTGTAIVVDSESTGNRLLRNKTGG
jgi:parallel beta-helix repeat protein